MYYELKITEDDNDTYLITSPDFPEVTSFCEDTESVEKYGTLAIQEAIAARVSDDQDLPAFHNHRPEYAFEMNLNTQIKIELWQLLHKSGLKRADIKRALGLNNPQVARIFDLSHQTKTDTLDLVFKELGHRLVVQVKKLRQTT